MPTIYTCFHCGDRFKSELKTGLCKNCNTAEKRAKMDEENKEIFEAAGLTFTCKYDERTTARA